MSFFITTVLCIFLLEIYELSYHVYNKAILTRVKSLLNHKWLSVKAKSVVVTVESKLNRSGIAMLNQS